MFHKNESMIDLSKYKRRKVVDYAPQHPSFLSPQLQCTIGQKKLLIRQAEWLRANYSDCTDLELAMTLCCDKSMVERYAHNNSLQKSYKFVVWAKTHDPSLPVEPPRTHIESDEELLARIRQESKDDIIFAADYADTFDFCNSSERKALTNVLFDALRWGREHT